MPPIAAHFLRAKSFSARSHALVNGSAGLQRFASRQRRFLWVCSIEAASGQRLSFFVRLLGALIFRPVVVLGIA
jgi:hypothetical protein